MELIDAMTQASKGMKAQGIRMRVISENLANADTAATSPNGEPYQRKTVTFKNTLDREIGEKTVSVSKISSTQDKYILKYDPSHPGADANGYVKTPNINTLIEMMDMREAQRSYEANLGVIDVSKSMLMRTLDMMSR